MDYDPNNPEDVARFRAYADAKDAQLDPLRHRLIDLRERIDL